MTVTTKFNKGQIVFFLYNNRIVRNPIESIKILIQDWETIEYIFEIGNPENPTIINIYEQDVFSTAEQVSERILKKGLDQHYSI